MKKYLASLSVVHLMLCSSISLAADDAFLVEIDPLTYVQEGYSLHLRYHTDPWTLGVGTYAIDLPLVLVELNDRNEGWQDKIDSAYVFFLDYHLSREKNTWLVGLEITTQSHEVKFENQTASFDAVAYLTRVGYHYEPFDNGLYLFPWVGVGYTNILSGSPSLASGDETFDLKNVTSFATLHVGYRF